MMVLRYLYLFLFSVIQLITIMLIPYDYCL
nr:MAG TPA: hypothetical protein [Caudoviricetes sp.]